MGDERKDKIERYLKNTTRFLWGLGPRNQRETYKWLAEKGFTLNNGTPSGSYDVVTSGLLKEHGIERIVKDLVKPRVEETLSMEHIDYLRGEWHKGQRPDLKKLGEEKGWDKFFPFLEINRQFKFVERWGELAGVWFEEIEKLPDESIDDFSSAEKLYKDYQETRNLTSLEGALQKLNDAIEKKGTATQKAKGLKQKLKDEITHQVIQILGQDNAGDFSAKPGTLNNIIERLMSFSPEKQRALVKFIELLKEDLPEGK